MLLDEYARILHETIETIRKHERMKILSAAEIVSETLMSGGLVRVFGCGHSHILAEETFYRAGGLVSVSPIFYEPLMLHESATKSSTLEKSEGLAEKIFDTVKFGKHDMLFCISTSGINAVPVEFAKLAWEANIPVIGISSSEYLTQKPNNQLGLHLQQVCTICINNYVPHGDACLKLEGSEIGMTPISTVSGTYIINSILAEAVRIAVEKGVEVPLYLSGNIPGGAEHNKELTEKYQSFIPYL